MRERLPHRALNPFPSCPPPAPLPPSAPHRLPALLALKQRLAAEGRGYSSVFMTGSGSTIVCIGSGEGGGGTHMLVASPLETPCGVYLAARWHWLGAAAAPARRARCPPSAPPTGGARPCAPPCRADDVPAFLQEPQYADLFVTPARLITRRAGEWYAAPARPSTSTAPEAAAAAAAVA